MSPPTRLPPLLVLDAHTPQALAAVRSLGRAGRRILVASPRRVTLGGASRWSAGRFRIREESRAGFARLRAWAVERGVSVVLPMTERSCLLCNADREAWQDAGIVLGCAPDAMLLRAFDKARALEAGRRCGLPIPPTRVPAREDEYHAAAGEVGYPCVVKSRFSEALVGPALLRGGGASYVATPAQLLGAVESQRQGPHWPIIQGFVTGRGVGVSGLCDRGRIVALFAHERLRDVRPTGSGSSLRRAIALEERLRLPVERLVADLEWHGPIMVEFKDNGGAAPWLMEVNGRFWGSLQLAVLAGVDVPRWWVAMLEGQPVTPPQGYRVGVTLRWLWGDVKRLIKVAQGRPSGYPGAYPSVTDALREIFGPQPAGTRVETWDLADPGPAGAEWAQGAVELIGSGLRSLRRTVARNVALSPVSSAPAGSP